jgi:hypothetical protein
MCDLSYNEADRLITEADEVLDLDDFQILEPEILDVPPVVISLISDG